MNYSYMQDDLKDESASESISSDASAGVSASGGMLGVQASGGGGNAFAQDQLRGLTGANNDVAQFSIGNWGCNPSPSVADEVEKENVEKRRREQEARDQKVADEKARVDRTRDQLRGQFNVLKPDQVASGQNDITEAELEEMTRLHLRIEDGTSNIRILPSVSDKDTDSAEDKAKNKLKNAEFRDKTLADMRTMMTTRSGRELLKELDTKGDDKGSAQLTKIGAVDPNAADPLMRGPNTRATGMGADGKSLESTVRYNPGQYTDLGGGNRIGEIWSTVPSDVTLFHELSHARDHLNGGVSYQKIGNRTFNGKPEARIPEDRDVGDHEYRTVGLGKYANNPDALSENRYRAERQSLVKGKSGPGGEADYYPRTSYGLRTWKK